jgi:hypothetical protein
MKRAFGPGPEAATLLALKRNPDVAARRAPAVNCAPLWHGLPTMPCRWTEGLHVSLGHSGRPSVGRVARSGDRPQRAPLPQGGYVLQPRVAALRRHPGYAIP